MNSTFKTQAQKTATVTNLQLHDHKLRLGHVSLQKLLMTADFRIILEQELFFQFYSAQLLIQS